MMNSLIAILSNSFERIQDNKSYITYQEILDIIIEEYNSMSDESREYNYI